jgi:hypothetical protein
MFPQIFGFETAIVALGALWAFLAFVDLLSKKINLLELD